MKNSIQVFCLSVCLIFGISASAQTQIKNRKTKTATASTTTPSTSPTPANPSSTANNAKTQKKVLIEEDKKIGKTIFRITVESISSKPLAQGKGQCGTGEELTLNIFTNQSSTPIFSKLVESCLQSIELANGKFGAETGTTLTKSIFLEKNPIEIHYLSIAGRSNITGYVNLSSGKAVYTEK